MRPDLEAIIGLLHHCTYASLATNSRDGSGYPFLSVLPVGLDEQHCPVLLISDLAEHTRNLQADPRASLLVLDPDAIDVQASARLTLVGEIRPYIPDPLLIERYLRYQPNAEQLLSLGGFNFFRMHPQQVRFIGGFGRMGWLDFAEIEALAPLPLSSERALLADIAVRLTPPFELLGLDRWGIDYKVSGARHRVSLASAPVADETLAGAAASALTAVTATLPADQPQNRCD